MSGVTRTKERICYATLSKPYRTMLDSFTKAGIKTSGIFFVDGSGQGSKESGEDELVVFVSSARALTELDMTIKNVVKAGKIECVVFDSLSALIVYENPNTVMKFVHSLSSGLRAKKVSCLFMMIKSEAVGEVLEDVNMFVDESVDMSGNESPGEDREESGGPE